MEFRGMAKRVQILCLGCNGATYHFIRQEYEQSWNTEDSTGRSCYQIVECGGCSRVSYRTVTEGPEWYNSSTEQMEPEIELFPPRNSKTRSEKVLWNVPNKLLKLYSEVIVAYNAELNLLCSAGLRALVEGIALDKNITGGEVPKDFKNPSAGTTYMENLQGKIFGMAQKNLLTFTHAETLQCHRFLGNEALHQLKMPGSENLEAAIDVIEHTMENIYELPDKRSRIR